MAQPEDASRRDVFVQYDPFGAPSAHSDNAYVVRMAAAGAVGFLEKQTSASILIHAIHEAAKGNSFI